MALTLFIGPICINRITSYLNSNNEPIDGYSWVIALMVVFFFRSIIAV